MTNYGDEMRHSQHPKRRPRSVRCKACKRPIKPKRKGRMPSYCCRTCRQSAYVSRKYRGPMELLAQDIAVMRVRGILRREVWAILKEAGLVSQSEPPPPPRPQGPAQHLRLVKKK